MQSSLSRRARDQGSSGGEFCEVLSTLTHDLTKARNQLVRLMHQVKPGASRLYGGCSVPRELLRTNSTPCNARNCHRSPAPRIVGCGSPSVLPQRPCRPIMNVHGANRIGQAQQRGSFSRPQQKVPNCCVRNHNKVHYPCERQQQSDTSEASDASERSGQRDSTCVNITFDSPDPSPATRPAQLQRRDTNTCRGSKIAVLQESRDPGRLQGGGSLRRHNCVGTQFATLLQDVTLQMRERRLAADHVKPI